MPMKKRSRSSKPRSGWAKKVKVVALVVMVAVLTPLLVYFTATGEKTVLSVASVKAFVETAWAKATGSGGADNALVGSTPSAAEVAYITEVSDASSQLNGEWLGVCKKNSIHSVADFQRTVAGDAVLANHFAGFNWENARLGRQEQEMFVYVSHRKGEVIKSTSKPIRLPKGDGYITDGVRVARTFCCNDINITPSAGKSSGINISPSAGTVATPPIIAPAELMTATPIIPLVAVPGSIDPDPTIPPVPPPVHPVPEPGTLTLMGLGLAALAAAYRRRKR